MAGPQLTGPITDQTRGATIDESDINFESLFLSNDLSGSLQTVKGAASDSDSGLKVSTTGIGVDTISEKTSGSGVTIDGVLLKDSNVVANSNYLLEGYPTGRNVIRSISLSIIGLTDATQVRGLVADVWNGEALGVETVDSDFPTGGTRFDISADGLTMTIKGLSQTVIGGLIAVISYNDEGTQYIVKKLIINGGNIEVGLKNPATGVSKDLTALTDGNAVQIEIIYTTSS